MNAVEYNSSRGYTADTWRAVQNEVGVKPDGIPGARTADAVKGWQYMHDLLPDGKVGSATLQALLGEADADAAAVPMGVYWDHTAGLGIADAVDLLADIGVERVCVMLDDCPVSPYPETPQWEQALPLSALREIRDACAARCIATEAAVWPVPRPGHISAMGAELPERLKALGATRVQLDVEGNWEARDVEGFADLRAAAVELVRVLLPLGLPILITSFPFHAEFGSSPSFAHLIDGEVPQCYSRYNKGAADYQVGGKYGPGPFQRLGVERAARIDACPVEVACAAWDQTKLYSRAETGMLEAYKAATLAGALVVWWWSLKHVIKTGYAKKAIKQIAMTASS